MSRVVLLDGGMGQELVHRACDAPTTLWATQVMVDHPGMVAEVHRDYADAGASVATVNSYALHKDRFTGTAMEGRQAELVALALAEVAAVRGRVARIAGAIGPLVTTYKPETHPARDVAVPLYAELARLLAPGVDLILCESVASVAHAEAVLEGARAGGLPVWLSVTVDDADGALLRSGEPVVALDGLGPEAWLANCSAPEAMAAALRAFREFGVPFGAYANGFTQITKEYLADKSLTVTALKSRQISPESYAGTVMGWVEMGATIVGGCCEIGPAHIAEIARRLRAAGHEIV